MALDQVKEFLRRHGMASDGIDLPRCTAEFLRAMGDGLAGRPSSLHMIPTYLTNGGAVPQGETVIAMDAGGTNFRIGEVCFDGSDTPVIRGFQKHPIPGSQGEITCDEFFNELAAYVSDYEDVSDRVGFCFSFTTEIMPDRDGKIISFSKEVRVADAAGRMLGEGLNKALAARGLGLKRFTVLNDTVAAMLCGVGRGGKEYGGYIGFILGTGTNTCYMESLSKITKISGGEGSMAVNLESGCYDGFPRGDFDRDLDAASQNPGDHLTEKMIAGGYFGELVTRMIHGGLKEGLFSPRAGEKLDHSHIYTTREISDFIEGTGVLTEIFDDPEDKKALYALVDDYLERTARIITVNLAAILTQTGEGRDPEHPVCVAAEGTTFHKTALLRPKVEGYMKTYLRDELGFHCEIVKVEDATLIGSAAAALLNE